MTLTWAVGFVIIFFIMILFLAMTGIITAEKEIEEFSADISNMGEKKTFESGQKEAEYVLNTFLRYSPEGVPMYDIIYSNGDIKPFTNNFFSKVYYNNWSLKIDNTNFGGDLSCKKSKVERFIGEKKVILCIGGKDDE